MDKKERYYWRLKRRGNDITQKEVADHIGCSEAMVNMFERNKRNMRPERVDRYKQYILDREIIWEEI